MSRKEADAVRRVHITVCGGVQGVCFRYYTRNEARRLGLRGWVRNVPSGNVEILAEGLADEVNALVRWVQTGPPAARVDRVEADHVPSGGDLGPFEIRY